MISNEHITQNKWQRWMLVRCTIFVVIVVAGTWFNSEFWWSADQHGDVLFRRGKFAEAAKVYSDPLRIGVAQYRNGDFKEAAQSFARVPGADGAFNQGNALLMHGAYDNAIAAFNRSLGFRPGWKEARENKVLAIARRDKIQHSGEGAAVAPEDKPDAITFDNKGENKRSEAVDLALGDENNDAAFRATWLRRVQTTPGDFLRAKFAYQAQAHDNPAPENPK